MIQFSGSAVTIALFSAQQGPSSISELADFSGSPHHPTLATVLARNSAQHAWEGLAMSDTVELPLMHWLWLTALSGIVSNVGWELFTYFSHAMLHSFSSAWHEFKKLPSHLFSLHAPFRIAGVAIAALALISLMQTTGNFQFALVPLQLLETYRSYAYGLGDMIFAAIIDPQSRHLAYDLLIAGLIFVFVIWRTAKGWRNYGEFQSTHGGHDGGLSLTAYFGLQLLGGLGAVVIALVMLQRT